MLDAYMAFRYTRDDYMQFVAFCLASRETFGATFGARMQFLVSCIDSRHVGYFYAIFRMLNSLCTQQTNIPVYAGYLKTM